MDHMLPMATKRHQTKPNFKSSVIFVIKKEKIKKRVTVSCTLIIFNRKMWKIQL